ncbi:MAG: nucleotidyl transferase AbiEii/AbiGii toxin family protein [Coriobacteriia bacterium]|nr:nucleotidyl transferase AbiEii/AbiGii toxin family protein [Coriobacteriia bacterium]
MAIDLQGFQDRTLDKVNRLLGLLEELGRQPALKGKLCMHGGTAINIFMLEAPRLSVDIDMSYIGAVDRGEMLAERPFVEKAVEEAITFSGYTSSGGRGDHAGRTFHLRYMGSWGPDQIKIDLIYLNRAPLIAPQLRPCCLRPTLSVLTFSDLELIGGKIKALYDRVAARDIFDIVNLKLYLDGLLIKNPELKVLSHRILLFYVSMSNHFPLPLRQRAVDRFSGRDNELASQLYPMLRNSERPTLGHLIASAESFITDYVLPRDEREQEYLEFFAKADYRPTILFDDYPDTLAAAEVNPEALWKLANIKKMINKL